MEKNCPICKNSFKGRSDKAFCSVKCKSIYNNGLRKATELATKKIDIILHRNRSILLEIMGKNLKQKKINKSHLDSKNFKYDYCTGVYTNAQGKLYYIVYDFSWMKFSNGDILIVRRNTK